MARTVKAIAAVFVALFLFFVGFQVAQLPASGSPRGPGDLAARAAAADECLGVGACLRDDAITREIIENLRAAVTAESAMPVAALAAEKGLDAHLRDADMLRAASAAALTALAAALDVPRRRAALQRSLQALSLANENMYKAIVELARPVATKLALEVAGGRGGARAAGLASSAVEEDGHFRVMVSQWTFGMNIQVHRQVRVVEVLPGSTAEAAGVLRGFVLREVDGVPVDAHSWFEAYHAAKIPFALAFDTKVPIGEDDPYFPEREASAAAAPPQAAAGEEEHLPGERYENVPCTVKALPFGVHIEAPLGQRPRVAALARRSPAGRCAGLRLGAMLLEVAGRAVGSSTWFSAMEQAVLPYGLLFRLPRESEG